MSVTKKLCSVNTSVQEIADALDVIVRAGNITKRSLASQQSLKNHRTILAHQLIILVIEISMEKTKKAKKAFSNWRGGAFYLNFPNGNGLSTTFAAGSYSENYGSHDYNTWKGFSKGAIESNTVEVMIDCPDKLHKKLHKKYSGDGDNTVLGYLDQKQWLEIVVALAK